jgi:hypothetical protein
MGFYHEGVELFQKLKLSIESEITYSDFCKDMLLLHKDGIKFTDKALLLLYPSNEHDDWIEAESIDFLPWYNIYSIENITGNTTTEEYTPADIESWLATIMSPRLPYPFLSARPGNIAYLVSGMPRSERNKRNKAKLKQQVQELQGDIYERFGPPDTGPVEMMIDVFFSDATRRPDVDRLSIAIMDAFEGVAYINDKQVRHLQPRVFSSNAAYQQLECTGDPMGHFVLKNIPAGSLYPLATGLLDYYVVRIKTYWR